MVTFGILWCSIACYSVLHQAVQCNAVHCCAMLCCAVLCCAMLCCVFFSMLRCAALYCTVLWCIKLIRKDCCFMCFVCWGRIKKVPRTTLYGSSPLASLYSILYILCCMEAKEGQIINKQEEFCSSIFRLFLLTSTTNEKWLM